MRITDKIPLRTTAAWNQFKDIKPIPHGYGIARNDEPLQYDKNNTTLVLFDHPIIAITKVIRNDKQITNFELKNDVDTTGKLISFIRLEEALKQGETLSVTCQCKENPFTGGLMENPAYVIWDILNTISSIETDISLFDKFRLESDNIGMRIGGIIRDNSISIKATIDKILAGIGAMFNLSMPEICTYYNSSDQQDSGIVFTEKNANIKQSADINDIFNVLTINYRQGEASITVISDDSIQEFGEIKKTIDAGFLIDGWQAYNIAQRLLEFNAFPIYRLEIQSLIGIDVNPNDSATLQDNNFPITGKITIMSSVSSESKTAISALLSTEKPQKISIRSQSEKLDFPDDEISVLIPGKIRRTFEIVDEDGNVVPGATVTLDNNETKIANSSGQVEFIVGKGDHIIEYYSDNDQDNIKTIEFTI